MIRVTHLITSLDRGGAEMMLLNLLARYDRSRFEMEVVSLTPGGALSSTFEATGVRRTSLAMPRTRPSVFPVVSLVRALRKSRPDILQTWLYHADLVGTIAAKLARVPHLLWNVRCSDMQLQHYALTTRLVLRALTRLSKRPEAVIVNSEAGRAVHEEIGYTPRRWINIANGFDLTQYKRDEDARRRIRTELDISENEYVIGMTARYDVMKDHATFLQAAAKVVRARHDVTFVLAGRGVDDANLELKSHIDAIVEKKVRLLGERSDVAALLNAFDLFTLSSQFGEGFPNAVGEAMATELPAVVTDVGDCARLVASTGRVVPPRDPEALASAWLDVINRGRSYMAALGESARQRIADNFSITTVVREYEQLYSQLMQEKN